MLKSLIVRSQRKCIEITKTLDVFETQLTGSRNSVIEKILHVRNPRQRQPITMHNMSIISERVDTFVKSRQQIRQFKVQVEDKNQPHMRVYNMSIAARSRNQPNSLICPLDIPTPQIKHRLLGNIMGLRLEAMLYDDMFEFLPTLSSRGCPNDANRLYREALKKCNNFSKDAAKQKPECDSRQHYGLAVEIMLLQVEFISLQIRASSAMRSASKVMQLQKDGLKLLDMCTEYFQQYPSCQQYKSAADRARKLFTTGSFHQAMSLEERRDIARAMRTELQGTGHWYQCRNGHPVRLVLDSLIE